MAGGTLIGENRLIVMAGTECMEWYQTHGFHYYELFSPHQPPLQCVCIYVMTENISAHAKYFTGHIAALVQTSPNITKWVVEVCFYCTTGVQWILC